MSACRCRGVSWFRLDHVVAWGLVAMALPLLPSGCAVRKADDGSGGTGGELSGMVMIDGSSTVFPISQAVAEEFQKKYPRVKVVVGTSGTGGGFKKFVTGETDINDASRPIKQVEIDQCRQHGIEFLELRIAIDGLSVVVHPDNDWCDRLTVAQLREIWRPGSKVNNWSDVDPSWPQERIRLFGPDTDSGTFDYFTEVVCGESGASRTDYTPSADDNVLVRGVSGERYSLGYFGYAYYAENRDKLKAVAIAPGDDPSAAVLPTDETIESGQYKPLSRPLFLYVNRASLKKLPVVEFLRYYLTEGQKLVSEVGYVRLSQSAVEQMRKELDQAIRAATASQ